MKISSKQRTLIIAGIGTVFIVLGLLQGLFGIKINEKIMDQVSFVLMILAIYLFFNGRKGIAKKAVEQKSNSDEEDNIDKKCIVEAKSNIEDAGSSNSKE